MISKKVDPELEELMPEDMADAYRKGKLTTRGPFPMHEGATGVLGDQLPPGSVDELRKLHSWSERGAGDCRDDDNT